MKLNLNNTSLFISVGLPKQFPALPLPQIAFSGRSNVGKSSLINALLQRKKLARVSGTPGKTITVNFYSVDKKLFLVDLPGYGYAKRTLEEKKKWSQLTDGYFTDNKNIDLLKAVIQLVDARIGPTEQDLQMMGFLSELEIPYILVYTKIDKLNKTQRGALEKSNEGASYAAAADAVILFSAETGEGREKLWNQIGAACGL